MAVACAAPVIVRSTSIMPVSVIPDDILALKPEYFAEYLHKQVAIGFTITRQCIEENLYDPRYSPAWMSWLEQNAQVST